MIWHLVFGIWDFKTVATATVFYLALFTATRARPFARREANTLRPFLVAMRERKPCFLTRFFVLG